MPHRSASFLTFVVASVVFILAVSVQSQSSLTPLPRVGRAPADNPTTPEKVALGRLLFWDPILSGRRDVACATCHHPDFAYAEPLDLSIGTHGVGLGRARHFESSEPRPFVKRNSQTVLNAAFNGLETDGTYNPAAAPMFWDVRVRSLESQALEPIKALEEMRGDIYSESDALRVVVARLADIEDYRERFTRAFGGKVPVTVENLGKAIAAFERSLVAANSPFDRYMRGETAAMTPLQVRGMQAFQRIGCVNCHSGPMFSDYQLHVIGVPDNSKLSESDAGAGRYAFRTASLRNLAFTAPYMHNGTLRTLNDVVEFYDDVQNGGGRGGRRGGGGARSRNPNVSRQDLDPLVRDLNLGRGRRDVVSFLEALSDPAFDRTIPDEVPSGLKVGGEIR
jgi:cytochrome c peroxidase